MRNLAGTGRAGWQLLGVDEEYGTPVMALDMTGGQVILKIHDLSLVCVADRMCSIEMCMQPAAVINRLSSRLHLDAASCGAQAKHPH